MDSKLKDLKIQIFADGAEVASILELSRNPLIQGFTTNPTLMRKSGVQNYEKFAKSLLHEIKDKPISFEIFSDEYEEMKSQSLRIADWGENVFVKIPVTNTRGESSRTLIEFLTNRGVKLNITAVFTLEQVKEVFHSINPEIENFISIFAGRIADTGIDPTSIVAESLNLVSEKSKIKIIWASPRELLNIFQADQIGCHVITATSDILNKLNLIGKNLEEFSLETVQMFKRDAELSRFSL